jgi:uncharacterized repeat protein (TIGR01451 family)
MIGRGFEYLVLAMMVAASLFFVVDSFAQQASTSGGTIIQTQGYGLYKDDEGREHRTTSDIVRIYLQTVTLLSVTPNETAPSAQVQRYQEFTRLFRICNGGNDSERVMVSKIEISSPARVMGLSFDVDGSGTLSGTDLEIRIAETLSPNLGPGACTGVLVLLNSESFPAQTNLAVRLTARSTNAAAANGIQEATGQIINAVSDGPRITGPDGLAPALLVNGRLQTVASAHDVLTYSLALSNSGDGPAQGIVYLDHLPEGLEYVAGTFRVDGELLRDVDSGSGATVSTSVVELTLPSLAPGQLMRLEYQVSVSEGVAPGGGLVNFGIISGQNFAAVKTNETVVVVDPFGIVFAAHGGAGSPVPGASIILLTDASGTTPLSIAAGAGLPPNLQNLNPMIADARGRFNFTLGPEQLGSSAASAVYYLRVTAPGFTNRMLKVTLNATHSGLFRATFIAVDGQAIAGASGFDLVREAVTVEDLASLSRNIPMFETHSLTIDKTVDKQRAEIGDAVTYTININNPTPTTIAKVILKDTMPRSFQYAAGTSRILKGNSVTGAGWSTLAGQSTRHDNELTMNLGDLAPAGQMRIQYRVRIGANAQEGDQFNQAFATGQFPDGELIRTDTARVSVYVGAGAFSTRQIILGRVYEDLNRNGRFDKKDRAIAGARVYLMNGQYVLTDPAGLYNFPTVGDGAVVIALDPISITAGLSLRDEGHISGRSWARMLRTPLGGGSLLHQDFALVGGNVSGELAGAAVSVTHAKPAPTAVAIRKSDGTSDDRRTALAPGTYETAATEKIAPVKPGTALIVTPTSYSAVVSTGSEIQARVAIDWRVLLEINDKPVSEKNIGETRVDHANQVTTYTFAGLTLPPGPNKLRVTPIGPANERGTPVELKVMGRGPVRRIEVLTEVKELTSGGKDSLRATIRAWDQWDNPALDGFVAIEATNVLVMTVDSALRPDVFTAQGSSIRPSLDRKGTDFDRPVPANARQVNDLRSQMGIALKDGEAQIKLVAPGVATAAHLKVIMLQAVGELDLRIVTEKRPTLLVGLAEAAFGNVPGFPETRSRNRLAFFFRGTIREKNILTLSYDSLRPLNRTAGEDRLFQLDPLERAYPVFGDSSTRFEEAQSNSKLYARLDRGRSYAMFGDFDADLNGLALAGYSRKLTGVKLHLEDRGGSFITLTGARPGTAFARDVIPGGALSLVQLSFTDILAGSENVTLEVRDRRNPEIILSSEVLIRSVDYNLDAITGQIFFLRFISTFDYSLNLTQIVVTYEHRANGFNSMVLTGRGVKKFSALGLQIGFSGISQRQDKGSAFHLGGLDVVQRLPRAGAIKAAASWSNGAIDGLGSGASVNVAGTGSEHNGFAYDIDYNQPVAFLEGVVHGRLAAASAGFLNPFGTTITPGSRRGEIAFGFKPRASSTARLSFVNERNKTERVDNSRSTFSALWAESISENLKLNLGYDHRKFSDNHGDGDVVSNLFTIGAEWQATKKLQLSAKREQNLGSSDPTYPNQTTIGANYQLNDWAKLFFTHRIASAPIVPIADTTGTGFALSSARSEMAFGVETKLSRFTSMTGRYQIDNGAGTADSFAVIGLVNRLPISKELSLELGYERGFHLQGQGQNFNSVTLGAGWQPRENFAAHVRYELRDRNGLEHLFVIGAAGRVNQSITALSRFQVARTRAGGQQTSIAEGMAAVAIRPATSDRMGLLLSYTRRSRELTGTTNLGATRDRLDSLSSDAFFQLTPRLELSGRLAARLNSDQQQQTPVSTLTYLTQGRMQYRFAKQFDLAAEMRALIQANSGTARKSYAGELGFWPLPDLRLGAGYNFALATEPQGNIIVSTRRGFYFNISTKLSNFFNLFGTSRNDLTTSGGDSGPRTIKEVQK